MPSSAGFPLGSRTLLTGSPCYVVAEVSVNFDGDLAIAKQSIESAAKAGADAVKFQIFDADEFVQNRSLTYTYENLDGSKIEESQYDMFKRLELKTDWHAILQSHAQEYGIEYLCSAADPRAVDLLIELKSPALKLASEDLINTTLLEYVASTKWPTILSTGMADEVEITQAVEIFKKAQHNDLMILHCVSTYPAPLAELHLNRIVALREKFQCPIGYSDHSVGSEAAVLAVTLGATLIEKHFTIDKSRHGPDHRISADPTDLRNLIQEVRKAESMLGTTDLHYSDCEEQGRTNFRRSIVAGINLRAGTILAKNDLLYKRPGAGLKPYERDLIIGKTLIRDLQENEQITEKDVQ